ncbi:MAG: AbrB/MazE/SpoVT family DNA-binding domain-containing protein [Caulobacteraceae bacterium]|nr:AbrB/MazE/SpoVT family DNA-binding domain-containing protein [Caulobacteraceae bacterium]
MLPAQMDEIASRYATVSDKIRALAAAGCARADIARFLGKRYQHVRNVLVEGRPPTQVGTPPSLQSSSELPGLQETGRTFDRKASNGIIRLPIGADGSIQLPALLHKALGYHPGGIAVAELREDSLVLLSAGESLRRAQAIVRELIPGSDSLADSLIEDRRREAAEEDES